MTAHEREAKLNSLGETTQAVYRTMVGQYAVWERVPTIRDLMLLVGISSTSVASYHLNKLMEAGLVVRPVKRKHALVLPGVSHG